MFKNRVLPVVLLLIVFIISSCSNYQKLLKSTDNEEKYEMAIVYYNQGDYYRAKELFEEVLPFFRGTDKAEILYYYYSYCHYEQGDNILASYYFKRFTKNFPNSKYAEECLYMSAYCKSLDSPKYSLDQTNTIEAINELQLFIDVFPNSDRVTECYELINNLKLKLERKMFEISKLYLKMDHYQAAITSFNSMLKTYPNTNYREDVLFYLTESYYYYAINSIASKQKERLQETLEVYDLFVTNYPDSGYKKHADNYYKNSRKLLAN